MTPKQIRARIDALECLSDLITSVEDVGSTEFMDGETVDLSITEHSDKKLPIAFVHALHPEIVLIGLRAMQQAMEKITVEAA